MITNLELMMRLKDCYFYVVYFNRIWCHNIYFHEILGGLFRISRYKRKNIKNIVLSIRKIFILYRFYKLGMYIGESRLVVFILCILIFRPSLSKHHQASTALLKRAVTEMANDKPGEEEEEVYIMLYI